MTDMVLQARALRVHPGETLDETSAVFVAQRLADEVEQLRAQIADWGKYDTPAWQANERLNTMLDDFRAEVAALRAAGDALAEAAESLHDACEYEANQTGGDFSPLVGPAAYATETAVSAYKEAIR